MSTPPKVYPFALPRVTEFRGPEPMRDYAWALARRDARLSEFRAEFEPIAREAIAESLRPVLVEALAADVEALSVTGQAVADGLGLVELTPWEIAELDRIAFAAVQRQTLAKGALTRGARRAELIASSRWIRDALVASVGAPGLVQPWHGILAPENVPTGDGRLIASGALTHAALPLPLRFAPSDTGGHNGAIVVGRIDRLARGDDGMVYGAGVIDLGSPAGQEAARLIAGRFLRGVSVDLDSTDTEAADLGDSVLAVVGSGRVRAATLVAIPAFDEASIQLVGDPIPDPGPGSDVTSPADPASAPADPDDGLVALDTGDADPSDCGCDDAAPGVHHFHPAASVARSDRSKP